MPRGTPPASRRSIEPLARRSRGRVVSRVDAGHLAGSGVEDSEEGGRETLSATAVLAGIAVNAFDQRDERVTTSSERVQAGLEGGHQQGGGHAPAGNISNDTEHTT